jgi:phosphoglycerate dehydrogenase-like enzyme
MHPRDGSKPRLGVVGTMDGPYLSEMVARFPVIEIVPAGDGDLDALLMWQLDAAAVVDAVARHPGLRWVHLRWAGVPAAVLEAMRTHPAVLTNGSGAHGLAVAEYVAGVILAHYKGFRALYAAHDRAEWLVDFRLRELRGACVGIVGLGDLGGSIARVMRGFGVRLRGLRRSEALCADVDELFQPPSLAAFLDGLDVLVVAAPLTAETHGLIGADELARLRPGAMLVNVGRALVVDQPAMISALRSGQLGGAALDVFEAEPLPSDSPLWQMGNVFISPHCCDATPRSLERGFELLLDNLGRFGRGEPLRNVVDRAAGY